MTDKTVYLYVYGEGDCDALSFERNYNAQRVYEEMEKEGVKTKELIDKDFDESDGYFITVKIIEFGAVDPEFETFMYNEFLDYDALKRSNIYRVEPVK